MNNFWDKYDSLIKDLDDTNKLELSQKLRHVKKYVNGLTDGWFDFKNGLKDILNSNNNLDKTELSRLKEIIKMTEKELRKR